MPEQRHFHRIKFAVKTDIDIDGELTETSLIDISLKGALVVSPQTVHSVQGSTCRLKIHLNFSDVVLSVAGNVIHCHDGLLGIKFTLIDIDSMIHLRRLIELNSDDPDQVRSELNDLISSGSGQQ